MTMFSGKRPSMSDRALSSPQGLQINVSTSSSDRDAVNSKFASILTPPISPAFSRYSRSSIDLSSPQNEFRHGINGGEFQGRDSLDSSCVATLHTEDGTLICPYDVEVLTDNRDRKQMFGYGAWSNVYKGTCHYARAHTSGLVTPPASRFASPPVLVAVKTPARNDAKAILASEANVLSHIMMQPDQGQYVVTFYGMVPSDSSLVLAALPTSLEDYIRSCALTARASRTTGNMTWPVLGTERVWLSLANDLVTALAWLHNEAAVIHGDIKPGNILLLPLGDMESNDEGRIPFRPVFTDFSSSQFINSSEPTLNTLSAVTREYTAPELLSSKVLKDPTSTATTASDVFSLAVTLLVAATGNTMVYTGSVFQRQAMATQGWGIISMVKSCDDGMRIPRQGIVERVIEKAVLKHDMGRIDAHSWQDMVEKMMHGDPTKHEYQDSRWN